MGFVVAKVGDLIVTINLGALAPELASLLWKLASIIDSPTGSVLG